MILRIEDDFDLSKIADCGQCFRARYFDDGSWRFVTRDQVAYIKRASEYDFEARLYDFSGKNMSEKEIWDNVWKPYFNLSRNYGDIRRLSESDPFMYRASELGKGIRILRQDPFEMLITFIISQRKSIPAIKKSVEAICIHFGRRVENDMEEIYLFPIPTDIDIGEATKLLECSLGYRLDYIKSAVSMVASGELDLKKLEDLSDEELFEALKAVRGVGDKVSNCICLFAYGRTGRAPVDVWIKRMMDEHYNGENPFLAYGDAAGIMQQYIFYFAQQTK